jgi:hypothetical protein
MQPSFQILSVLQDQIQIVRAQSRIRSGIVSKLEREYTSLQNSIDSLSHTIQHNASVVQQQHRSDVVSGTAIVFMNDSPKWFQRRYSSMILNILTNIPLSWSLQIFHYNSSQFFKGLALNHGLRRLVEDTDSRVTLLAIPKHIKRKNKNKHMLFLPWVWEHMPTEMVLLIGGNHVLCSNSPHTLHDFLPSAFVGSKWSGVREGEGANGRHDGYDYLGAPWQNQKGQGGGGGVSLRNVTAMRAILQQTLAASFSSSPPSSLSSSTQTAHLKWGEEDVFFVSKMLQANKYAGARFKLATPLVRLLL